MSAVPVDLVMLVGDSRLMVVLMTHVLLPSPSALRSSPIHIHWLASHRSEDLGLHSYVLFYEVGAPFAIFCIRYWRAVHCRVYISEAEADCSEDALASDGCFYPIEMAQSLWTYSIQVN